MNKKHIPSFQEWIKTQPPVVTEHKMLEHDEDCSDLWFFTGLAVVVIVLLTLVICVWRVLYELPAF